jgi:radical SAM protein with 4Fe4S-binding SPASM domain
MKIIVQEARNSDYDKKRAASLLEALRSRRQISLILEVCSRCNLNCNFCDLHSGKLKNMEGQEGIMEEKLYYKIIEDIANLGYKLKALHFHGWGEPLIQKKLPEMIGFARQKGVADKLILITNGVLMDEIVFEKLLVSGLDEIRVSLDTVDSEKYIKIKGRDHLQTVLNNIDHAINRISAKDKLKFYIKIPGTASDKSFGVSDEDTQAVINKYKNIDNPNVGIILQPLIVTHDAGILNHKPCEEVFYTALIRFDGRVSACCVDILGNLNIGNISNESLSQILNGKKLRRIRKVHSSGDLKELPQCLHCGFRTSLDLTPYVGEIDKLV